MHELARDLRVLTAGVVHAAVCALQ
jgi:hypothetical protein